MSVTKRDPFPLQWPDGWARHNGTRYGRGRAKPHALFEPRFAMDRDSVIRQLKMRGSQIVITSNLPTRSDGLPYANASFNQYDPGIAVYWVERGRERVIACDRWKSTDLNLRAIDMSLEAMRGLDRWGCSDMVERAFAGFAALPASGETTFGSGEGAVVPPPPWREVLFAGEWAGFSCSSNAVTLKLAKDRYRDMMKDAHPDVGGSPERAAALNVAMEAAEAELAPAPGSIS